MACQTNMSTNQRGGRDNFLTCQKYSMENHITKMVELYLQLPYREPASCLAWEFHSWLVLRTICEGAESVPICQVWRDRCHWKKQQERMCDQNSSSHTSHSMVTHEQRNGPLPPVKKCMARSHNNWVWLSRHDPFVVQHSGLCVQK